MTPEEFDDVRDLFKEGPNTPAELQVYLLALLERALAGAVTGGFDLDDGRAQRKAQVYFDLESVWRALMVANSSSNPGYEERDIGRVIGRAQRDTLARVQRTSKVLHRAVSVRGGQ